MLQGDSLRALVFPYSRRKEPSCFWHCCSGSLWRCTGHQSQGGQFNGIELLVYIGSTLSYFGLAVLVIDFLITPCPCCKGNVAKEYYKGKKLESVIGPRSAVMYVSFVDRKDIYLVDTELNKSLQETNGKIVELQRCSSDMGDVQLPVTVSQNPEELLLLNRAEESDRTSVPWCVCGRCHPLDERREQLCCRKSTGLCVTTAPHFVMPYA